MGLVGQLQDARQAEAKQTKAPERSRRTSEGLTQLPARVRTDVMPREELSEELHNFYDMLAATVTSSQDELSRLRSTLADKDSQREPRLSYAAGAATVPGHHAMSTGNSRDAKSPCLYLAMGMEMLAWLAWHERCHGREQQVPGVPW